MTGENTLVEETLGLPTLWKEDPEGQGLSQWRPPLWDKGCGSGDEEVSSWPHARLQECFPRDVSSPWKTNKTFSMSEIVPGIRIRKGRSGVYTAMPATRVPRQKHQCLHCRACPDASAVQEEKGDDRCTRTLVQELSKRGLFFRRR